MAGLILKLLGRPEAVSNGRPVSFPTRKALALLIYLAVEGGTYSRDRLVDLFWPESGPGQGRSTLRSTLAMLRGALGAAGAALEADRESLRFDPNAAVDLDVRTLEQAAATRQLPLAQAGPAPAAPLRALLAQLQAAADLYRGDFLEGFSLPDAPGFDDWASFQREARHRQAVRVFDWLSQLQSDGGQLANATATTARWLALDPLNEAAHRRLMLCHFAAGDRSAALQAYAACRALLARELNAEPSPETEALARRLRAQPPASRDEPAASPAPAEAPLVGRATEHMNLVTAYRLARKGQPQAALIAGEPGIGKTRLAREFTAWAAAQGAEVLHGGAFEIGGRVPYQPIVDALRARLSGDQSLGQWLSEAWLAELARLLPELRDEHPNLPAPLALAEGEAQARLFEAVARVGMGLVGRAPARTLVVFLDDWQWADAGSLDLLTYLARRWAPSVAFLLVLAARSDDLGSLADWLGRLPRDLPLTRLTLPPLSLADTLQLLQSTGVEATLAPEARAGLGERLFADTGGHPFFILQTLKSLAEGPERPLTERAPGAMPSGIRELIRTRLSRLSPEALALCQAGAVLGAGFEFEHACRVAELSEGDGLRALEALLERGLLREGTRLSFTHDRLREVAYGELTETRRRVLHRRALESLAGAPPAELARHALAAGRLEEAFRLLALAGDEALRVFAVRDALGYYEQAAALIPQLPPPEVQYRALYLQLGRAHEIASEWEPARTSFERLRQLAREAGDLGLQSQALTQQAAVVARGSFDLRTAAGLLLQAQPLAESSGEAPAQIEIEANLAQVSLYAWDAPALIGHAESALALAREMGAPELIARCLNMLAYSGTITSEWDAMGVKAEESRALYASLGNRLMESDNLALVSAAHTHSGRLAEGREAGQAAYDLALRLENDWAQANSAWYLAHALLEMGELGQALTVARAGVAAARAAGHPPLLAFNLGILGRLYRSLFALNEALPAHQECQAIGEALHQPLVLEWSASELCADYALSGDWEHAAQQARRALPLRANNPSVTPFAGQIRWHETEALLRAGDGAAAQDDLRLFERQIGERRRYRLAYLRAQAALAAPEAALDLLREATALVESIGLPGELWQLDAALGEAEKARAIVDALAGSVEDEGLKRTFLAAARDSID